MILGLIAFVIGMLSAVVWLLVEGAMRWMSATVRLRVRSVLVTTASFMSSIVTASVLNAFFFASAEAAVSSDGALAAAALVGIVLAVVSLSLIRLDQPAQQP